MFILKEGTPEGEIGKGTDEATQKQMTQWLEGQGFTLRNADQDKSYISAHSQPEVDKAFKGFTEQVEAAVLEVTKTEKNAGEKATEYLKRALGVNVELVAGLNTELQTLKDSTTQGNEVAEGYKKDLTKLQDEYKTLQETHEGEITKLKSAEFNNRVNNLVLGAVSEIRGTFRKDVEDVLLEDIITARLNKLFKENTAKQLDDVIVFADANGATVTSKQDGKPMSVAEVTHGYFSDLIDKNRKQGGAGSGKGAAGADGAGTDVELPESVKTLQQLHEYLTIDLKMDSNTEEFGKLYAELGKDLPMREIKKRTALA